MAHERTIELLQTQVSTCQRLRNEVQDRRDALRQELEAEKQKNKEEKLRIQRELDEVMYGPELSTDDDEDTDDPSQFDAAPAASSSTKRQQKRKKVKKGKTKQVEMSIEEEDAWIAYFRRARLVEDIMHAGKQVFHAGPPEYFVAYITAALVLAGTTYGFPNVEYRTSVFQHMVDDLKIPEEALSQILTWSEYPTSFLMARATDIYSVILEQESRANE
jgi:hypothetical protein